MKLPSGNGPLTGAIRALQRQQQAQLPRSTVGMLTTVSPLGVTVRPLRGGFARRGRTNPNGDLNVWR